MARYSLLTIKNIAYFYILINIMADIISAEAAASAETGVGTGTPQEGTLSAAAWRKTVSPKQEYDDIPNTLSTTAHIHTLLFQPGSGAPGYDTLGASASVTPLPSSSMPQPSLRGALPMRTQSLPTTTSIVGLTARTYQDDLVTSFPEYFRNLTMLKDTSEGGAALHEAPRGTFLYCLFSPWKWKTTLTLYTPGRKIITEKLVIIISFGMLLVICSILALMHLVQGLHGGAHHQLGTHSRRTHTT